MADFDLSQLMQQAQQMREQMEYLQKGLAEQSVEGSAGGGMVKVKMTGAQQVTAIEIDEAAMSEDREMLQDLIVAATNNAIEKSKALAQEGLGSMLPPGLFPGGVPNL
ncbi:YbaB/EbfC family nucleoid-associated protein [Pseudenhygromyxa sp. WMMC2535]|uniref:YbaB/EbfC family nucleoid-associated protein n=1 Tax=Pseudenhygromyxa sp. WMMC2535 TaxID=2712867 RepID=UPI001552499F|nr:YbaB/EbfC family nucleoid-associated protein [Pseudenhygromyxa sp. WMMC2535]NVB38080.1 YbaB/EbfC family nucleoid-associated protein [Pseudenhygromyxa sp. WMMC2535]